MKVWRDWLSVYRDEAERVVLAEEDLRGLINELPTPDSQFPSLALMVGQHEKQNFLSASHPDYNLTSKGIAQVHLANPSATHPTWIVDVSPNEMYSGHRPVRRPMLQRRLVADWLSNSTSYKLESLVDAVFQQLMHHFVDVVCLFLDDFPTPDSAFEQLRRWLGSLSTFPSPWRPHLLLITSKRSRRRCFSSAGFSNVRYVRNQQKVSPRRSLCIQRALDHEIRAVRSNRIACQLLFSAPHLNAMVRHALQALAQSSPAPLDLCRFAYSSIMDRDLAECLKIFVQACQDASSTVEFITKYLASALLLLSRPPRMHYFNPVLVFSTLFEPTCRMTALQFALPSSWCGALLAEYCALTDELSKTGTAAIQMHKRNVASLDIDWNKIRSSKLCLWCLVGGPEHPLYCGHSICNDCAKAFGELTSAEYTFVIRYCILCKHKEDLTIRLKPPTAGPRVLVLDGGGVRGAFTLLALKALEDNRELPYPLRDEFDLVIGSSSGGLIALMLMLGRSISNCIKTFDSMVQRVFQTKRNNFWMVKALLGLRSFLTDSIYGAANIEACVKEAYGAGRLFGERLVSQKLSGLKCAVTTMTVTDSKLCLLANYNGPSQREGYRLYRPVNTDDEVSICTAARATSAAPSYFPAKYVAGFGFVQDGGAGKHNNPVEPAEWESRAIWRALPDLILSVGTGYAVTDNNATSIPHKLGLHGRFFPRLLRLFEELLDSETHWQDHLKQIHDLRKDAYIRINMALQNGTELDDVARLAEIKLWSTQFLRNFDFRHSTRALLSASFFLELDMLPREDRDGCACAGTIRCRSPDPPALLTRLVQEYPQAYFILDDDCYLGQVGEAQICTVCNTYCKDVTFRIKKESQDLRVYLRFDRYYKKLISGFSAKPFGSFTKAEASLCLWKVGSSRSSDRDGRALSMPAHEQTKSKGSDKIYQEALLKSQCVSGQLTLHQFSRKDTQDGQAHTAKLND